MNQSLSRLLEVLSLNHIPPGERFLHLLVTYFLLRLSFYTPLVILSRLYMYNREHHNAA